MTDNLDLEITQWVSKAIAPVAKATDHEAIARMHDVKANQHADIANGLSDASASTPDSRSAHFFQSAAQANAHASIKHADAADSHRSADPSNANDVAGARDASEKAFQASQTADTANQTAQDIANSQALSAGIYDDASNGNNNYVADYNQRVFGKDAGYGDDGDDTDDSSDGMVDDGDSEVDDDALASSNLAQLIISAESAADDGDNYREQSAQAYTAGDTDSAAQLSMLATDAYMTAHNYMRQAAAAVGMVGDFEKAADYGHAFRGNQYTQGTGGMGGGKQPVPGRYPVAGRFGANPNMARPAPKTPQQQEEERRQNRIDGFVDIHGYKPGDSPMERFQRGELDPPVKSKWGEGHQGLPDSHPLKASEEYHQMHGNNHPDVYDAQ
jgi:hypothetical protein